MVIEQNRETCFVSSHQTAAATSWPELSSSYAGNYQSDDSQDPDTEICTSQVPSLNFSIIYLFSSV